MSGPSTIDALAVQVCRAVRDVREDDQAWIGIDCLEEFLGLDDLRLVDAAVAFASAKGLAVDRRRARAQRAAAPGRTGRRHVSRTYPIREGNLAGSAGDDGQMIHQPTWSVTMPLDNVVHAKSLTTTLHYLKRGPEKPVRYVFDPPPGVPPMERHRRSARHPH